MLSGLVQPKLSYLGDKSSLLSIEMLREAYIPVAISLKRARDRQSNRKIKELPNLKLKHHKKQNWDPNYMPNLRICKIINNGTYDLQDPTVHVWHATVAEIQFLIPTE